MITKIISYNQYNRADQIRIQADGSVICHLFIEQEVNDDPAFNGIEQLDIQKETVLGFPEKMWPFELTEEELAELNPQAEPSCI